ncbi:DUF3732 domain-containing protein [Archangium gephyra]|uniref:DUF3732 domain-containing protein n=1 Tax=Archangium gephyra TaxID=48 RepID=UPI003B7F4693
MSRWQIESFFLYSHHGQRKSLPLAKNSVNVISGPGDTGKTALINILNYCLASKSCNIPNRVGTAVSWVGALWCRGEQRFFVARRLRNAPEDKREFFVAEGTQLEIPESAEECVAQLSRNDAQHWLEGRLGIGVVRGANSHGSTATGRQVSLRNIIPYLVQGAGVIQSSETLFQEMIGGSGLRNIRALPYFLGVVDEGTFARQQRLRDLRKRLAIRAPGEQEPAAQMDLSELAPLAVLVSEAVQVGLCDAPTINSERGLRDALSGVIKAGIPAVSRRGTSDQVEELHERRDTLLRRLLVAKRRLSAADEAVDIASGYQQAASAQVNRLKVVGLFSEKLAEHCPVCESPISEPTETLQSIHAAISQLQREMGDARQVRPQLDDYRSSIEAEIERIGEELSTVDEKLKGLVNALEESGRVKSYRDRQFLVLGKIQYFMHMERERAAAATSKRTNVLREEYDLLSDSVDDAAIAKKLSEAEDEISALATEHIARLPFSKELKPWRVRFVAKKMSVHIRDGRAIKELSAVGSDENVVTLHLATVLALHKYFSSHRRPVPGFLVIDQISRPFYPADLGENEEKVEVDDRAIVKQYIDFLFDEVARQGDLQVLLLEHAYFRDDERFMSAARRWTDAERLIPDDWPDQPLEPELLEDSPEDDEV